MDAYGYDIYYKYINRLLDRYEISDEKDYVLYPSGNIANIVKDVLKNEYNIIPIFIVDNYKFDESVILNFKQAHQRNKKGAYYFICSDRDDIYDNIRKIIKENVSEEYIIDLFPHDISEEYRLKVSEILDTIDKEIFLEIKEDQ